MRKYPILTEQPTSRDFIDVFGGYNHNLRIGEGEFYDMKNLTSTHYPVLATRPKRGTYRDYTQIGYSSVGLIDKDGLWSFEVATGGNHTDPAMGSLIRLPGNKVNFTGAVEYGIDVKRTLVSMGAYLVIFPDNIYINTTELNYEANSYDATEYVHKLGATFTSTEEVTYQLCKADGTPYTPDTISDIEPTDPKNGDIWQDTSVSPNSFKVYSGANKMWSSVVTTYVRINSPYIGGRFKEGDGVRISGVTPEIWSDLNGVEENAASVIQSRDTDYIVVIGVPKNGEESEQTTPITVERIVPTMDFVIESNNRLWGCRYGLNRDGEMVNEIYASKLGDCTNWEYFPGTSQDSYVASLGSDGEFTGAISYMGTPLFFKQNCIHTVYGNYPASYQIQTTECRGVQKGCHNSIAIIDGTVFYKAVGGVCAYSGALPTEIGSALGEEGRRYYGAYGGALRHRYYLGMYDALTEGNTTWLYVFDTQKGLWHKEDEYNGQEFCYVNSETIDQLYYLLPEQKTVKKRQSDGTYTEETYTVHNIKTIIGEGEKADKEDIDWFAETGIIGCSSPDKKYVSRISFRLSIDVGTRVYVFAEYDSSGSWEQIGAITGTRFQTFTFPVRPKRCDHLRLRIVGTGEAKIFSISKTMEQGSEL